MAESFRDKRRRELAGQSVRATTQSTTQPVAAVQSAGSTKSFRQQRIAELNGTSPKHQQMQNNFDRSDRMMSTADSSKLRNDIENPAIRQTEAWRRLNAKDEWNYNASKAAENYVPTAAELYRLHEIERARSNAPAWGNRIDRAMDQFFLLSKPGQWINRFSQAGARASGISQQDMGFAADTGNRIGNKILDVAGSIGGLVANPAQVPGGMISAPYSAPATQTIAGAVGSRIANPVASRIATEATREAIAGAPVGPAQLLMQGESDPRKLARSAVEGAALGAVTGGLIRGGAEGVKAFKQRGVSKAVDDFVRNVEAAPADPAHPSGRIVQELQPTPGVKPGDQLASNFKRWEAIQQQHDTAVEQQYQYLKQSMNERGGVTQGNLIKDPTTGEVIDRVGRVSNNPRWYQDFYADNGRKPTDKDLRTLAKEHVNKGYADDSGTIPPWKPADIQDIDAEVAAIRRMMFLVEDPAERSALEQVASTLETSRSQIKQQLPEGVMGRVAPRPLPDMQDNYVKSLNHYSDTLYRETSPESALDLIPGSNVYTDTSGDLIYMANKRDLALGQGNNRGVMIEFDAGGLQGQVNKNKPAWEMAYKSGDAEFVAKLNKQGDYQNAVKSVTISADAKMDKITKARVKRVLSDWESQQNPDGSTTFFAPGKSPAVPVAAASESVQARTAPAVQTMAKTTPAPTTAPAAPVPSIASAAPVKPKKTISRTELVNNIKKFLGIVIDTGRTGGGKGVLGVYKVQPEVIRTAAAQDFDTIAHEIGHHLVKKYRLLDPQYEQELTNMMDTMAVHDYKSYPRHQWFDEGVAEYMRAYLSNPQQAKQLAPKFSAFLDRTLPKDVQKGLRNVQKDIKTWLDQGDYEQAKGLIDFAGKSEAQGASKSRLYTRFIDDLHPIELAEKALKGAVQLGSKSIYKLARLSRGVGEQAKMAVTRGIFDSKGNKLSDGLRDIVKPLEEIGMKEEDLATYLAVKHAGDLKAMGKQVPFTDQQAMAVLQQWDANPVVQAAHQKIIQYNNALLDIMVEAEIFTQKTVNELRKKYPNYVPFMRYFDDDAVAGFKGGGYGSSKGFANVTNPVKRMSEEGSQRTVINPLESMVKNTFLVMNAAAKNKVGLQLADLAKIDGAGAWVEHVAGASSPKEHIVNVWQNGERVAYKIRDPELHNAMLSLDNESVNSLVKFLGGAASILRGGATLTPEFMIRNAFRDVAGAIINSTKYGFNPLDFFKGFFHVVTKSDTYEKFVNSGGAMSTMMSLDRDTIREALQAIYKLSLKDKTLNVVTSPAEMAKYLSGYKLLKGTVGVLRKGAEISELSTKVGAFNKTLNKTGDIQEAAYTARDLMDFNRAGSAIRQANRAVAFLNASLQGTDKMARAFMENKASFLTRAFTTLVLPATMLYYWNRNLPQEMKDQYDNIPQWQKDSFFIIGVPGINEFVRIPKPFEAGMLFATSTDRMMEWLKGNDKEAFDGYGKAIVGSLTPPMLFTALSPLLEATTNHSFFRNAPIVPQGEQNRQKVDQFGVYTSDTAKELAGVADRVGLGDTNAASPRIIDNTIKGYTAGLGGYAVDLIDKGIKAADGKQHAADPAKKWSEDPFFRSFFVNTAGGGQIREDFYSEWTKLDRARNSAIIHAEDNADHGTSVDTKEVPFKNKDQYEQMKPYKKEIDKLMKEYKQVQRDKLLSAEQKRSQLDELDGKMNEAARKAVGK